MPEAPLLVPTEPPEPVVEVGNGAEAVPPDPEFPIEFDGDIVTPFKFVFIEVFAEFELLAATRLPVLGRPFKQLSVVKATRTPQLPNRKPNC